MATEAIAVGTGEAVSAVIASTKASPTRVNLKVAGGGDIPFGCFVDVEIQTATGWMVFETLKRHRGAFALEADGNFRLRRRRGSLACGAEYQLGA